MTDETQIAYLVKPVNLTNAGTLQGTSLRCYKVKVSNKKTTYSYTKFSILEVYSRLELINGEIVEKPTKAKLSGEYLSWVGIAENLTTLDSYGSTLFTNPETALASKVKTLSKLVNSAISDKQEALRKLNKHKENLPDMTKLEKKHPEIFI